MKQFLKVLIWVVILGGACFGIYKVLPEYPQNFVKSFVQPIVNNQAKIRIEQIQNLTNKDVNDMTYKAILEANTGMSAWVYEVLDDGTEYVRYYGNGAAMNLKDWTDYNGKLATSCSVKIEFKIVGNNVDIYPYIDGELMYISDGAHVEDNKEIKKSIFQQLSRGVTTN